MKFLVIEDNETLNRSIVEILSPMGKSDSAYDGEEGFFMAGTKSYDLIVLDLMLPKMSGLELLKQLRKTNNCPLLILTALDDVQKKIEGLKLGADDYMTKPFERDEFLARVEAILRRHNNNFKTNYVCDNIELDFAGKMFKINGKYVKVSGKMYDIMEYFIRNRNIVVNKEQLYNYVWGEDCNTVLSVTEVYVSNLRKILKSYHADKYLQTIKNVGYIWNENA